MTLPEAGLAAVLLMASLTAGYVFNRPLHRSREVERREPVGGSLPVRSWSTSQPSVAGFRRPVGHLKGDR